MATTAPLLPLHACSHCLSRRCVALLLSWPPPACAAIIDLKNELEKQEELIKEKQAQIRFAKASIIRNDAQIERLLSQVVRA